jgi:phosphatidylglycerol:prolipoprotein diacylglycerol transferase
MKTFEWAYIPYYIDPVLFSLGPVQIRWYGLMYLLAVLVSCGFIFYRIGETMALYGARRGARVQKHEFSKELIENYLFWAILGIIIGARLGYVLFYDLKYFLANPLAILSPFDFSNGFRYTGISGMSYHGGLIGIIASSVLFCKKHKVKFFYLADFITPAVPLGYTFGRIGNFLNGELYGRSTDAAWGMFFPLDTFHELRHPSQLYEGFFEGVFIFVILWSIRKKKLSDGFLFLLYLILYGSVRFFLEFFREPDPQMGFVLGPFSIGQILCLIMILAGCVIFKLKSSVAP